MVAVGRSIDERIFLRLRIWQKQDLDKEEICSEKDSLESKIMPRLRAEVTGWIVTLLGIDRIMLLTLASWELLPSKRNSVLEGFSDRKLADIQEETRDIIDSREDKPEGESVAEKEL